MKACVLQLAVAMMLLSGGCGMRMAPEATAMSPTINPGDRMNVDYGAYRNARPARWDIAMLRFDDKPQHKQVFRIVGLPGETVSFADGFVLINGKRQQPGGDLSRLRYSYPSAGTSPADAPAHPFKIPPEAYYVLGDNPKGAKDSRVLGSVPRANILGKVTVR